MVCKMSFQVQPTLIQYGYRPFKILIQIVIRTRGKASSNFALQTKFDLPEAVRIGVCLEISLQVEQEVVHQSIKVP